MDVIARVVCPSCPLSEQVRCVVLDEGFWSNLGTAILPFAVATAITALAAKRMG